MSRRRISCDELADRVVEALTALRPTEDAAGTTVEKLYLQQILDREYQATIAGRLVLVVPMGKRQVEGATRGQDEWGWDIRVLVIRRYTEAGDVPAAWTKIETIWVEENVLEALGDARREDFPKTLADLDFYPDEAEVEEFYDEDLLLRDKLFFSSVMFLFRRDE